MIIKKDNKYALLIEADNALQKVLSREKKRIKLVKKTNGPSDFAEQIQAYLDKGGLVKTLPLGHVQDQITIPAMEEYT